MLRSNNTKWQYRGQWSGLAVGKVAESTDDSSVSALLVSRNSSGACSLGKDSSQMFTPPEGPKFLPLSECPNLASTLTDRERRRIESLAETLLAQVHDGGFRVSLKPGTMKKSRKVYGDIHETYANWYIVVHRDFKPNRQDESVHDLGLDDNQTLAAALYLCEKLGASVKNVHLFKPFRPSAYVEAWLAQSEVSDVSLLRARHGAAAIALSEYRTNAIVGSEPICLFVDGVEHSVKTWRDVFITTCDIITKKDVALLRKAAASINNNYFGLQRTDKMRAPYCHEASGVWLNLYFSADGIVRYVKRIFDFCGFALDEIALVYSEEHRTGYVGRPLAESRDGQNASNVIADASSGSSEYDESIAALLQEKFSNGVRPASVIDQNKIRRTYVERYGRSLPDDLPLEQILIRIGISNDGKVFPRPISDNGGWNSVIEMLVKAGHRFFYFSRILEAHAAELLSAGVTSVDILKQLLTRDVAHSFVIGKNTFSSPGGPLKVIDAIADVVGGDAVVLSEKDVCRKLPYVPSDEIHSVLAGDGTFFWNSPDTYVMSDRISFDEQEVEASLVAIRKGIADREYYSLSQLDFGESAVLNDPRITVFAYRKVFSARFLSGEFDVRGQIVCRCGAEIDGCFPLRDYCRSHTELTLDQFFEVAREFNIGTETALVTVYEEMVRVSKELFVSPSLVTFDAVATDVDLARHCERNVSSLNSIGDLSDFAAVPGYTWNRFLLDSYLRRASREFAIRSISMPSQEVAGVIVRRDAGFDDVAAVFAEIAIGHGVAADPHEVGEFLVATRCTLRRGPSLIAQVVSKMRNLYERKR